MFNYHCDTLLHMMNINCLNLSSLSQGENYSSNAEQPLNYGHVHVQVQVLIYACLLYLRSKYLAPCLIQNIDLHMYMYMYMYMYFKTDTEKSNEMWCCKFPLQTGHNTQANIKSWNALPVTTHKLMLYPNICLIIIIGNANKQHWPPHDPHLQHITL